MHVIKKLSTLAIEIERYNAMQKKYKFANKPIHSFLSYLPLNYGNVFFFMPHEIFSRIMYTGKQISISKLYKVEPLPYAQTE